MSRSCELLTIWGVEKCRDHLLRTRTALWDMLWFNAVETEIEKAWPLSSTRMSEL